VLSLWVLVRVFANCLYQFVAAKVFVRSDKWSYLPMLGRALFANIDVAWIDASVIPASHFVFALAQVDPIEVAERLKFMPSLAQCIAAFYRPFHHVAVFSAESLDRAIAWPSARAAVYCAMFGIPHSEASRRVAETEAKFYASVLHVNCYVDYLMSFIGFVLGIPFACVGWTAGGSLAWITAGYAFLSVVACLHVARELLLGITDAACICYFENPQGFEEYSKEIADQFRFQYEVGVLRKVALASIRSQGGYTSFDD
jgi:hypothetical protein